MNPKPEPCADTVADRCDHRDDWGEWLGQWQKDRCGMESYRCAHCGRLLNDGSEGTG